ncbi:membrane-associating domain-containing protein [Aspergillus bertholletiae]|uniref:Membrane-associating domain-containing protein n=1 Tax=Aspergillus bertholletiae TaxID=1226010 RepID=A0A5N7B1A4_9EURO|nr:membrane-associating domain-containing protein [Aspergillus bertholletiae]
MALDFPWIYTVRVVQVVFAIIILGLTAYIVSVYNNDTVNFMLFNSIWTAFVATPYLALAPVHFPQIAHRFVIPAVEAITMIFWFAGFIALGVLLPAPMFCHWSACNCAQAATVFGAFEWALFATTTVVAVLGALRTRSSTGTKPAPQTTVHVGV